MRKRKIVITKPRVKGVHYIVHPEFEFVAEQYRKRLSKAGMSVGQVKVTQVIARELSKLKQKKIKLI